MQKDKNCFAFKTKQFDFKNKKINNSWVFSKRLLSESVDFSFKKLLLKSLLFWHGPFHFLLCTVLDSFLSQACSRKHILSDTWFLGLFISKVSLTGKNLFDVKTKTKQWHWRRIYWFTPFENFKRLLNCDSLHSSSIKVT